MRASSKRTARYHSSSENASQHWMRWRFSNLQQKQAQPEGSPSEFINRVTNNEFLIKKNIRMLKMELWNAAMQISPAFDELNSRGQPRTRTCKKKVKYSVSDHLFITFFWLVHYPTDAVMASIFNICSRELTKMIRRTLKSYRSTFQHLIQWPSDVQFDQYLAKFGPRLPDELKLAIYIIDGTEIKITRPSTSKDETRVYSVKKKQHSVTFLAMCLPDGQLLYVSNAMIGANDQSHWNGLNLRKKFLQKRYGIMGDSGFTFNRIRDTEKIKGFTPNKRPKGGSLNEPQKLLNKRLSQVRVIIENVFALTKKLRIIQGKYRHFSVLEHSTNAIDINDVVHTCFLFAQKKILCTPLRTGHWRPPSVDSMRISNILGWLCGENK